MLRTMALRDSMILEVPVAFGIGVAFLAMASATSPEMNTIGYLGGSGTDDGDGLALDPAGNSYLACHSDSPNFPGLPASAQPQSRDSMDAVVVKIEARTGHLVWATRTGGSAWDAAGNVEVGNDGFVYVLGSTRAAPVESIDASYSLEVSREDLQTLKTR